MTRINDVLSFVNNASALERVEVLNELIEVMGIDDIVSAMHEYDIIKTTIEIGNTTEIVDAVVEAVESEVLVKAITEHEGSHPITITGSELLYELERLGYDVKRSKKQDGKLIVRVGDEIVYGSKENESFAVVIIKGYGV